MSIVVGTLTIDLKANTASFSQSMDKMSALSAKTANDVKRSLEKIARAGLALATGVAAATATLIETSVNTINSLSRLSQATGTTVEKFSALAYAARISHVEVDDMAKGMEKLAKSAFGAQNGNAGLERIFGRLKISVTDSNHHLKDTSDLFTEVAVKFSGMANGAGKTALAMALFGKAGAAMIPLLNELGKHQAELTEQAKRFGLVIGEDVTAKAHKFHEVLTQLHAAQMGFGIQLTAAVLPALLALSDRLQKLGKDFDIPKLAQEFGQKVTSAVNLAGHALEFAVKHAHALKIAIEALASLQSAKIAIPFLVELTSGTLIAGIGKLTTSVLGIGKLLPLLEKFGMAARLAASDILFFAQAEGIGATASYYFGAALAAIGGPVTIAVAAIAGIAALMYKFRAATFSARGEVYELRDAFVALWQILTFQNKDGEKSFTSVMARLKKERRPEDYGPKKEDGGPVTKDELPQPDTEGLGAPKKEKKDFYSEEVVKLVELVNAQKAYLGVLDASPEKIAEVASAEKAAAVILALNTKLLDEKRPALTKAEKATISYLVATEEALKVDHEYGQELVSQQHAADLATQQARAMATANLEGVDAVRAAITANAILGLTYNRTAWELRQMAPELVKLNALLTQKQTTDLVETINKDIFALQQDIAMKRISVNAAGQFVDAQRAAALAVRLYTLNQQLATEKDAEAIAALEKKRDLIIDLTKAEWSEEDAKASIALRTPLEQYQEEINALGREVAALEKAQGGTLTYSQSLQVAARAEDAFNKATDETVNLLLRFGRVGDGVKAFFLDMQKSAKSAAAIIYDTLHSAFEKLSDQLTELMTGGKTDFGKMFKDIGKQMLNSTLKSGLQQGLGAIGSKMGINLGGALGGKPDGTQGHPFWVKMAKDAGLNFGGAGSGASSSDDPAAAGADAGAGLFAGLLGKASGFFGSLLKGLLGDGGGGMGTLAGAFAGGGDMSPDKAYLVGENGPEVRRGNRITSNAASRRMLEGQASNHYYSIDARGTDPVLTAQRTREAIIASHNSAVGKTEQVHQEQIKRNPQRGA